MAGMQKTGHATCIDGRYLENSRHAICIEGRYVEKSGRTTCIDGMPVQCRQHPPPELEKPLQKDYIEKQNSCKCAKFTKSITTTTTTKTLQ
jgi:hypothetical protein